MPSAAEPRHAFENSFPTPETVQDVYEEQDLQHAIDAYRFFYPTVSMEAIFRGNRDLGLVDSGAIACVAAQPRHLCLTANSDTPYSCAVWDLETHGPVVVEMPAGPFVAFIDDHHQRWVVDLGLPGPDAGKGGKYLVLPPDFRGVAPAGYYVQRAETYKIMLGVRAMPLEGGVTDALAALRKVKVYPLANPDGALPYVDVTNLPLDSTPLRWENNLEYWRQLHAVIDSEPVLEEFRPMYGVLAALGLERGRLFAPDPRMQRILEVAARLGLEQLRVEGFASQRRERMVWDNRRWEWVCLMSEDPNFETADYLDLQARDRWFFQAIGTSPAMFRREVGVGSIYFLAVRDDSGAYLDGGNSYKLDIPLPVPAQQFWSVTVYDARTRSQAQTDQSRAVISSIEDQTLAGNGDGSIELYFGPTAPAGRTERWLQTSPGTGFFLYFRIYGPEAEALDGDWRLGDVVRVDTGSATERTHSGASRDLLRAISTPDIVDSRIGTLRFSDGVPSDETVARVYDTLDHMHAVEAFLNSYQAASLGAIRKALQEAGVDDNEVLLFSSLMDSRSLFLTANCDTVYFFSCLDLTAGPIVVEIPPNVLGVFDDMWFEWVSDFGSAGPDRGEGGRYLIVPRHYGGPLPEAGFFVCRSNTNHVFTLGRAFLENNDPTPAVARIRHHLRIYAYVPGGYGSSVAAYLANKTPLAAPGAPPPPRFVEGSGLEINTIPPNDVSYYELLDAVVQSEPAEALNPELAGQFAALGIRKGHEWNPDARMKKILGDAVALANATARTLGMRARAAEGFRYYEPTSAWLNPLFVSGFEFLRPPPSVGVHGVESAPNPGARTLNARTSFFYMATGISPAMCMRVTGMGSQYLAAMWDSEGRPLDGAKTYKLSLPPDIPAALLWSLTLYDNQTRSMLRTQQRFPRVGSQAYPTPAALPSANGATQIYIGPAQPLSATSSNWIQTVPGRGWFPILRLYSPLQAFFDRSWRPSELVEVPAES